MSQILTWQASHESLNMPDKIMAVGKAYGTNGLGLFDIKNGIQFYIESAKRRICTMNKTRLSNDLLINPLIATLYFKYTNK